MIFHSNFRARQTGIGQTFCKLGALVGLLGAMVGGNSTAAPVTFWFSGTITSTYNPSNSLPSGIAPGTAFNGRVTYEVLPGSYSTGFTNTIGARSNVYLTTLAGVSTLLQIGGHTLTNTDSIPGLSTGTLHINDNTDNEDHFSFYTGFAGMSLDGVLTTNSFWSLYLTDQTKSAYSSATFPTNPPTLAAFPNLRTFNWVQRDDQDKYIFSATGVIQMITTNELVALTFHRTGATTAQLGWPLPVSGFTLQSTTNPAIGPWQNVGTAPVASGAEHTVIVSTTGAPNFYRLKK